MIVSAVPADNEPGAGGGDDGGGSIGGGGGWFGPWDDEDFEDEEAEPSGAISKADSFLWRMGCLVVALQVHQQHDVAETDASQATHSEQQMHGWRIASWLGDHSMYALRSRVDL